MGHSVSYLPHSNIIPQYGTVHPLPRSTPHFTHITHAARVHTLNSGFAHSLRCEAFPWWSGLSKAEFVFHRRGVQFFFIF